MKYNLALIGCGPHAHRVYLKLIEKYIAKKNINPCVLVDLKSQKNKVENYLKDVSFKFNEIIYLDDKELHSERFSKRTKEVLDTLHKKYKLDGIILSTEPKAHKKYCIWALNNNIFVLADKPITSPINSSTTKKGALKIEENFLEIFNAQKKSKARVIVQCQRRYHDGYQFLIKYLSDFVKKYQVPITYVDIFHGDGCWVMPNEFFERENHPYKYGYGKLMHSGYHFVDLLAWIVSVNKSLVKYNQGEVFSRPLRPSDLSAQIKKSNHNNLFGNKAIKHIYKDYDLMQLNKHGEVDCYSKINFFNKDKLVTSCNLDLLQNSFSRRAWSELPLDTYKGNGRVRHERVNIEIGPLLNIQVHSYQAYETRNPEKINGFGNEDHFEIHIYRNSQLIGGKSFQKYDFGESDRKKHGRDKYYLGHNERARDVAFLEFLAKNDTLSNLREQVFTIQLLKEISHSLSKTYKGTNPLVKFLPTL